MKKLVSCKNCGKEFLVPLRGRSSALCEDCKRSKAQGWIDVEEKDHPVFGRVIVQKKGSKVRMIVKE